MKSDATETEGTCSRNDSRGVLWNGKANEFAFKTCFTEGRNAGSPVKLKHAFWFCNKTLGDFDTSEPDRSSCSDPWLDDVEDMLNNNSSAFDISESIHNGLENSTDGFPPVGGTILKLGQILPQLLKLRNTENSTNNFNFTNNLIFSINKVFNSSVGWMEISDLGTRNQLVTNYTQALDYTGYLYAIKDNSSDNFTEKKFEFSKIHLTSRKVESNDTQCFIFDFGSICFSLKEFQVSCICKKLVLQSYSINKKLSGPVKLY